MPTMFGVPGFLKKDHKSKGKGLSKPAIVMAPVSKTDPERIKLTLQEQRLKCAELEQELNEMRAAIVKTNIEVDHELSNDFAKIFDEADDKITPFMSLFWQQQKKLFPSSRTGVRYHPMIIRFCLSLAAKSRSCYEELRNSSVGTPKSATPERLSKCHSATTWIPRGNCSGVELLN